MNSRSVTNRGSTLYIPCFLGLGVFNDGQILPAHPSMVPSDNTPCHVHRAGAKTESYAVHHLSCQPAWY